MKNGLVTLKNLSPEPRSVRSLALFIPRSGQLLNSSSRRFFISLSFVQMNISDLEKRVAAISEAQAEILARRNTWETRTKELLISTLTRIKDAYQLNWTVQNNDFMKNMESVTLAFNNAPSGIMGDFNGNYQMLTKNGGYICFAQDYFSNIYVFIKYPSVDEIMHAIDEVKEMGRHAPEEIGEDLILALVGEFLDEIQKWESSAFKNKIGFEVNK